MAGTISKEDLQEYLEEIDQEEQKLTGDKEEDLKRVEERVIDYRIKQLRDHDQEFKGRSNELAGKRGAVNRLLNKISGEEERL